MKLREALPLYLKRTRRQSDGSMRNKDEEEEPELEDDESVAALEEGFPTLSLS